MIKTKKLKGKTLLSQVLGWYLLIYIYIYIYLLDFYKYSSSWLENDLLPCFFLPLYLNLPFTFISSHNSSTSYTWRVEIVLLKLLSHTEHTSKFYRVILFVPPLFIVISSLMRSEEWLSHI